MKIRARISAKLKDQSGASITYALLLFLVCAVVSTVVLAAGTAASGRMSQSVESDQRYYAVTSAAEYLKKQLDGKSWIQRTDEEGNVSPGGGVAESSLLNAFSSAIVGESALPDNLGTLKLEASGHDELAVDINATLDADRLTLALSNHDTSKGTYTLEMEFSVESLPERKGKDAASKDVTVKQVNWSLHSISTKVAAPASAEAAGQA